MLLEQLVSSDYFHYKILDKQALMINPTANSLIQDLKKTWMSLIRSLQADSLAVSLDGEGLISLGSTVAPKEKKNTGKGRSQKCETTHTYLPDSMGLCWVGAAACQVDVEESRANNEFQKTTKWMHSHAEQLHKYKVLTRFAHICRTKSQKLFFLL